MCPALRSAALAKLAAESGKASSQMYVLLKVALQTAKEASRGLLDELSEAIAQVEAAVQGQLDGLGLSSARGWDSTGGATAIA